MNNAAMAYNELSLKKTPTDSFVKLFSEIDTAVCKNLIEQGYSTEEIEDVIMSRSYGFKNTKPEQMKDYLSSRIPQGKKGISPATPIWEAYEREKTAYASRFQELLCDVDAEIICDLKEQKYSMKNILDAFSQFSPIKAFLRNDEFFSKYKSAVIERSNSAHFKRLYKNIEDAAKLYSHLGQHVLGKHKGYTSDNVSHVREGSIVLSMMIEHNVPIDIIGKVLEKNSPIAKKEGEGYIPKILHRLASIQEAYSRIANSKSAAPDNDVTSLYYAAAHEYMERTGTSILCARDDQHILAELMRHKLNKEQIVTILACSPVALEIGRNLHDYVKNLSDYFEANYDKIKGISLENVREKARERLEYYNRYFHIDIEEHSSKKNERLIHALICKDLLLSECNPDLIAPAMKELVSEPSDSTGYLSELISKASEAAKAEQNIKNFKIYDEADGSEEQEARELSPQELFMLVASDKIRDNPSFIRRWSYSSELDADIMETVMVKYPETDKSKLKEALLENSPKALLAEDKEAYAQEILGKLGRRNELNRIGQETVLAKQEEYTKQCGIATEGTSKDSLMSSYVDGKVAIKLLLSGKPPLEVRNAILMAAEPKGISPGEYADKILESSMKVFDRLRTISSHVPAKAAIGASVGLNVLYLDFLSEQYSMKGFVQSKMDIDAFYMLKEKGAEAEAIKEIIKEYSPVYVEPGRNEEYLDYVENNAHDRLLEEEQKLKLYKAVARENHEDYLTEYAKHQRDLQKNIALAYSPSMDEIIVEAMLIQGFTDSEISKALEQSPVRDDDSYANRIIEKTKDRMQDHEYAALKEQDVHKGPVRVQNRETDE